MYLSVHNNTIYNSQDVEATKCSSADEWIKKMCTCIMKYYSAIKKNEIMSSAATWMDLE